MKKILVINSVYNKGSTGHIIKDLSLIINSNNFECFIAYGRKKIKLDNDHVFYFGNIISFLIHVLVSRLLDLHGKGSFFATKKLIKHIERINPDLINLHNIHGYYLNYKILFNYLKKNNIPVVWTLHDCWSYTGHCAYYSFNKCDGWIKNECLKCLHKETYPASILLSNSHRNYKTKCGIFSSIEKITIVTPSNWLKNEVSKSFLNSKNIILINNGINTEVFKPIKTIESNKKIILGIANVWERRKGFHDFIKLSTFLKNDEIIVLIGLTKKQLKKLPKNIIGITRTDNQDQLIDWYSKALVFVNPTYEDNFPTTNLEALACGTPVITYNTGGSPEALNDKIGFVVNTGMVEQIYDCIKKIEYQGKEAFSSKCRDYAVSYYNKDDKFYEYINLYNSILNSKF